MCQGFQIPTQGLTPLPYFHDLTTDPNQGCCPPNNTAIFPTPDPGPKPKAKGFTRLTPLIFMILTSDPNQNPRVSAS